MFRRLITSGWLTVENLDHMATKIRDALGLDSERATPPLVTIVTVNHASIHQPATRLHQELVHGSPTVHRFSPSYGAIHMATHDNMLMLTTSFAAQTDVAAAGPTLSKVKPGHTHLAIARGQVTARTCAPVGYHLWLQWTAEADPADLLARYAEG